MPTTKVLDLSSNSKDQIKLSKVKINLSEKEHLKLPSSQIKDKDKVINKTITSRILL